MKEAIKRKTIKEIYVLRTIACLCVVLVHSITRVVELYHNQFTGHEEQYFMGVRLILTFGTPIFIFLSEFLLAYSYSEDIPQGFMKKRVQLILMPYVSMAFIYAILMSHEANSLYLGNVIGSLAIYTLRNLLFGFYRHGYFIIVIFQFYFLHLLFYKRLSRLSPRKVLISSLIINIIYLGFFNFVDPANIPYGYHIWRGLSWASFPSWIFYFSLGYYFGRYYEYITEKLQYHKTKIFILPPLTGAIVCYLYFSGILTVNDSKRIDMILFSTSMFFLIYYVALKLKKAPIFFNFISSFSFGIYLLHMIFIYVIFEIMKHEHYKALHPILTLALLFLGSVVSSIATTFLISRFKLGKYIVGDLRIPKNSFIRKWCDKEVKNLEGDN